MKTLVLAVGCLVSSFAFAQSKPAVADYLSEAEGLDACAEQLPKQLACKQEFCDAMVDIRKKLQPRFKDVKREEMVAGCLTEISVDGTGDLKTRRDRCAAWAKGRPPMKVARADAAASAACFSKATCGEQIGCWAPLAEKQMAAKK